MKTADKQRRTTVGACKKNGLDCTKSGTKKTARHRQKATEKKSTEATGQLVPPQNQPSSLQTLVMQTSNQAILPGNSVSMLKQYPQCSGKLKLQLFPIDEVTQKGLEQDKFNPYLELILPTRKKISSVVKHLTIKWGGSKSASGDLMLFPYNAYLDNLVSHGRWTIKDSDTSAADVYAAVGSPALFRLRYGWFSNLEPTTCERPLASLHSEDYLQIKETQIINTSDGKIPQCSASSIENGSACFHNSLSQGIGAPPVLDKSVQALDNLALLSWADCLSNVSIGTLPSEAPLTQNSSLQQIPFTCDSFDAAVASFIACQQIKNQSTQLSNSSIWNAEETCHAFAFQKSTSSNNNDPASSRDAPLDACTQNISSTLVRPYDMLVTQVVHALPAATNLQLPIKNDATPEPTPEATADLQPHAEDDASKDLKTSAESQMEASCDNDFGRVDIYGSQSSGPSGCIISPSRQMSGGDRSNLGTLIETSLDAFQNFSIF